MLSFEQDPNDPFFLSRLTEIAVPFADYGFTPFALGLSFAWVAGIPFVLHFALRYHRDKKYRESLGVALAVTAGLLLAPVVFVGITGLLGSRANIPLSAVEYVTQPSLTTKSFASEFTQWANDRYGVMVPDDTARTFRFDAGNMYDTKGHSRVVEVGENELYTVFAPSGAMRLFDAANDKELAVVAAAP